MAKSKYPVKVSVKWIVPAHGNPHSIGESLASIATSGGGVLNPSSVIKHARHESSPLHSLFDWDDTEAANKYRLIQARQLIRSVRVVVQSGNELPVRKLAYVHYRDAQTSGYINASGAAANPVQRDQVIQYARVKISALENQLRAFEALCDEADGLASVNRSLKEKSIRGDRLAMV